MQLQSRRIQSVEPSGVNTAEQSEEESKEDNVLIYDGQLHFNSSNQITVENSIMEKFEEESILVGKNEGISANTSLASYRAREDKIHRETEKSVKFAAGSTPVIDSQP